MVKPLVEIALATYNGGLYLEFFLRSICNQSYSNWRILVRDDGSTDNTLQILRDFSAAYTNKLLLIEDKLGNIGVRKNFNTILNNCTAEYVMLADQDDIWLPEKIEKTLEIMLQMNNTKPLLVFTDLMLIDDEDSIISRSFWRKLGLNPLNALKFNRLLVGNVITGCTVMINYNLLRKALPIPEEAIMHDWWLGLVASAFGKVAYIKEPLILYRQHLNNVVGAWEWGIAYFAHRILDGIDDIKKENRKNILKCQIQANAFNDIYINELQPSVYKYVLNFITIDKKSFLLKRLIALRHGFIRCGIVRNILFYLFM